jgi:hypothetical protein
MKIICYGNCQIGAVSCYLNKIGKTNKYYACFILNSQIDEFYKELETTDILILQPINDIYKNDNRLSSLSVINYCKSDAKIIMMQSYYFNFYYPDLKYLSKNNVIFREPIDYHYQTIIDAYNNNISIDEYIINKYMDPNLYLSDYLNNNADISIKELRKRYDEMINKYNNKNIFFINILDYIENNYKEILLFYSMNHPSKYLMIEVMKHIFEILDIDENYIDTEGDYLANAKCILHKCIQNVVNFDINSHKLLTSKKETIYEIVKLYYDEYSKDENKIYLR